MELGGGGRGKCDKHHSQVGSEFNRSHRKLRNKLLLAHIGLQRQELSQHSQLVLHHLILLINSYQKYLITETKPDCSNESNCSSKSVHLPRKLQKFKFVPFQNQTNN